MEVKVMVPGVDFFVTLIIYILIFLIVTLSYNIAYGYTGVPDFGRAMAAGAGGFLCGYLPGRIMAYILGIQGDYLENSLSIVESVNASLKENPLMSIALLVLTLFLAALAGGALGLLASLPMFRGLRLFYLGVTLLAIQIGFNTIAYYWKPLIGGPLGVTVPDPFRWLTNYSLLGISPSSMRLIGVIIASGIILLIVGYYCISVGKSPLGRLLKAVRDDEKGIETLGRDTRKLYVKVMAVTYAFTGVAGALFAYYGGYVVGLQFDKVGWTFWPVAMVILGGLANYKGTVVGTTAFITLRRFILFYKTELEFMLPFSPVWLEDLILGIVLILILIYRPRGLLPEKPEIPLSREEIEKIKEEHR
jgi:branched-chain amino acid transport system permease protein